MDARRSPASPTPPEMAALARHVIDGSEREINQEPAISPAIVAGLRIEGSARVPSSHNRAGERRRDADALRHIEKCASPRMRRAVAHRRVVVPRPRVTARAALPKSAHAVPLAQPCVDALAGLAVALSQAPPVAMGLRVEVSEAALPVECSAHATIVSAIVTGERGRASSVARSTFA